MNKLLKIILLMSVICTNGITHECDQVHHNNQFMIQKTLDKYEEFKHQQQVLAMPKHGIFRPLMTLALVAVTAYTVYKLLFNNVEYKGKLVETMNITITKNNEHINNMGLLLAGIEFENPCEAKKVSHRVVRVHVEDDDGIFLLGDVIGDRFVEIKKELNREINKWSSTGATLLDSSVTSEDVNITYITGSENTSSNSESQYTDTIKILPFYYNIWSKFPHSNVSLKQYFKDMLRGSNIS